jgi:3-oxoacyl-[acyl-carrier protein] reductase
MPTSEAPVAVVTGAAQGIGAAIAHRLGQDGFRVALLDLQAEAVEERARQLKGDAAQSLALGCDVTSPEQVADAFDTIGAAWQRVDVLVSNAGITRDSMFYRMPPEDWDAVIATHLRGGYLMAQAAQKFMVRQNSGAIIFLSSRAATGNRGQANYSAAKAGLEGLTKTLAIELGPYGITVNAIAPGFIDSPMTRAIEQRSGRSWDEIAADVIDRNYIKRLGRPEDIAGAVSFLASPDATYLTGQVIQVGGR